MTHESVEPTDPMERKVLAALRELQTPIAMDSNTPPHLDFYLPEFDVHIEVKQFHSDRIAEQMSRVDNVIVIQGLIAAEFFASIVARIKSETEARKKAEAERDAAYRQAALAGDR